MIFIGMMGGSGQGKTTVARMLREMVGAGPECDLETSYVITVVLNSWIQTWPDPIDATADIIDIANELIPALIPILNQLTHRELTFDSLKVERNEASLDLNKKLLDYLLARRTVGEKVQELFPAPITPDNKQLHRSLFQWMGSIGVLRIDATFWSELTGKQVEQLKNTNVPLVTLGGIRFPADLAMVHALDGIVVKVTRPNMSVGTDPTEATMTQLVSDVDVLNNGSLEQLRTAVEQLWQDLQAGHPANEYKAN